MKLVKVIRGVCMALAALIFVGSGVLAGKHMATAPALSIMLLLIASMLMAVLIWWPPLGRRNNSARKLN